MTTQPTEEQVVLINRLVALDRELKELKDKNHMLEVDISAMRGSCAAMGREAAKAHRQKSQYFRCVKWFMSNTHFASEEIPGHVRHTLVHVAGVVAANAERQV